MTTKLGKLMTAYADRNGGLTSIQVKVSFAITDSVYLYLQVKIEALFVVLLHFDFAKGRAADPCVLF